MLPTHRKQRITLCALFPALFAVVSVSPCAFSQPAAAGSHRLVVLYRESASPLVRRAAAISVGAQPVSDHGAFAAAVVTGDAAAEAALRNDPDVEYVFEDRPVSANSVVVQPSSSGQRAATVRANVPRLDLPGNIAEDGDSFYNNSPQGWAVRAVGGANGNGGAWNVTTGRGVRIAVLDSGVDATHPDIAPNLAINLSEVMPSQMPSACDDGSPADQSGHGTWVASLAAGAAGASTGRVVGVAPEATLINIKVLQRMPGAGATATEQCSNGQPSGMISWVLQGVQDALAQKADVIVLSMSTTLDLYSGDSAGVKASFDRITHAAAAAGAIVVAAAGNDAFDFTNPRYVTVPAQSRDVLAAVASTNPDCAQNLAATATCSAGPVSLAYYSNYGAPLNAVAAPGGSYPTGGDEDVSGWVRGACSRGLPGTTDGLPADAVHSEGCFNLGHDAYVQAIGTSASAPLVAGVVALVRAAHPDWTAATVLAAVRASGQASQASGQASPGMPYGVVNAAAAIAYKP